MAKPTKSIILVDHEGNQEILSNCLCFEVTGKGSISIRDVLLNPLPGCENLALEAITAPEAGGVLTIRAEVAAGSGTAFGHVESLGWYPRCIKPGSYWLGEAVSPPMGGLYPYENRYAMAQAGGDPGKIPGGVEPRTLTIEIHAPGAAYPHGAIKVKDDLFESVRRLSGAEPETDQPDAVAVVLGVMGDARLRVQLSGVAPAAPANLQAPLTLGVNAEFKQRMLTTRMKALVPLR